MKSEIRNPKSEIPASLLRRARDIRLLVLDVDGVLTDGRLVYESSGEAQMAFHVHDGQGMKLALDCGIGLAIVTGRRSAMVALRAKELGVADLHQGAEDKLEVWEALLARRRLRPSQAACMGDDLGDLPMLRRAGLAISVPGAVPEVRAAAHYVTRRSGGQGAVREAVDLLLKAQGHWKRILEDYR
jgi:3-deoxy-D-manno-octulosonate 8-phosphate phosphatase (KDO 8-P phosphatase)